MWYWLTRGATTEQRAELYASLRPPVVVEAVMVGQPVPEHHPGTTPPNIPRPSWYKSDAAAFQSSVQAARDAGLRPVS